jgi:hypothetical protein
VIELKKVLMALALMVLLSVLASAENDSVTTGPYKISFDLGFPKETYNITVMPRTKNEELSGTFDSYNVMIKNNTGPSRKLQIMISQNKIFSLIKLLSPLEAAATMQDSIIKDMNRRGYKNIEASTREIDNTTGALGVGDDPSSGWTPYFASYYLLHEGLVILTSTYPWEHGTLQLLKTIHVENVTREQ